VSGKRLRNKGLQAKHVWTVNGRVKLLRRWWHDPLVGSLAPLDQLIDLEERSYSPGVREMACRLNNDGHNFDRAAANLLRTAQIRISGEQLRQLVLGEGRAVLTAQRLNTVSVAFQAADCKVPGTKVTRIYTGCDGVLVPLITEAEKQLRRKKVCRKRGRRGRCRPLPPRKRGTDQPFKEFKVLTFYDETGRRWHETLSASPRRNIGTLLRREAQRLGFAQAQQRVANVDGAPWIRERLQERPEQLPLDGLGLDFYHLSENVHRCRRSVCGEDDPQGKSWAEGLLHCLKHEGYEAAWDKLVAWRAGLRGPRKRPAADRLLNYVSERREMIRYPEFQARGWQIGSGPTESRCKTSTQRLKGRGRRWDPRNAEAVAALTTLHDSHQWRSYWKTQGVTCT
jgi:hypothetical protein